MKGEPDEPLPADAVESFQSEFAELHGVVANVFKLLEANVDLGRLLSFDFGDNNWRHTSSETTIGDIQSETYKKIRSAFGLPAIEIELNELDTDALQKTLESKIRDPQGNFPRDSETFGKRRFKAKDIIHFLVSAKFPGVDPGIAEGLKAVQDLFAAATAQTSADWVDMFSTEVAISTGGASEGLSVTPFLGPSTAGEIGMFHDHVLRIFDQRP